MQLLYNSDHYVVVRFEVPSRDESAPNLTRGGFEIVDKLSRREIFIEGAVAERFSAGVQELAAGNPGPEVYDDFIAGFTGAAQQPVVLH
jgi:Protein of unknown function (DUF3567)